MIEDNEWLRSKALLALLHANGRDPAAAVTQLRTGLLSGFVRAKALHIVVTKPWPAPMGDGHVLINMDVPALLWAGLGFPSNSRTACPLQCFSHGWRGARPTWKRLGYPARMVRREALA